MMLPPQPWMARPGTQRILAALEGETRVVGGAVRDGLLGMAVSDVDLATRLLPEEVVQRLEAAGLKVVPTGIAHGTVTAIAGESIIEVTTLRRDVATDGRRATVAFSDDWREDAARRDFTINALYANPADGEIFDYFGGIADLEARCVRFIGDPLQRIAEDHLRILRFFRFHARFGGAADAEALAACAARARDLMALSRERIRDELLKLLCVADPVPTLQLMLDRAILAPVFPEIVVDRLPDLARLVEMEHALGEPCAPLRRLAALLPADMTLLDDVAVRLRLSNLDRKRLVASADRLPAIPSMIGPLAYRAGPASAADRLLLAAAGSDAVAAPLAELRSWQEPRLPISGRDVIALGVPAGPEVSRLMMKIEDDWIEAGFPDRDATLELARQALARSSDR